MHASLRTLPLVAILRGVRPDEADAVAADAFERRLVMPGRAEPAARLGDNFLPRKHQLLIG